MGMFDDIKYEGRNFQTKDLECELDQYTIRDDRLFKALYKVVDLPEAEHKPDSIFPNIIHTTKRVPNGDQDMEYHGFLHFYDWVESTTTLETYKAKFTDGNLVSVTKIER